MADVQPGTLKPDIADGMYMKFQRNLHIFCSEQHSAGRRYAQICVGVDEWEIKDGGLKLEADMK